MKTIKDKSGRDRTFGYWLRLFRREAEMSQEDLAKATGISRGSIINWEKDVSSPRNPDDIHTLAKALQLDDSYDDLKAEVLLFTAGYPTQRRAQEIEKALPSHYFSGIVEGVSEQHSGLLNPFETLNHYLIRYSSSIASVFTKGLIYYPEKYLSDMKNLLEEKPLKHTQCILISRSRTHELDTLSLEESEDYFDMWDRVTIEVQPEELFRNILKKICSSISPPEARPLHSFGGGR